MLSSSRVYNLTQKDVEDYHEAVGKKGKALICQAKDIDIFLNAIRDGVEVSKAWLLTGVPELKDIFAVLDALGISKYLDFLSNTAITVPLKKKVLGIENMIYVPWNIGEGTNFELARQVVTLSHELTHCLDANTNPGWLFRYLSDFDERTMAEKRGFHTSMEVWYWLYQFRPKVSNHLGRIDAYYLTPTNIRVLRKMLTDLIDPIIDGAVYTEAAKFCIDFFEKRWNLVN